MRYPLKRLALPAPDAQRLEHATVVDSDYHLLARAATPERSWSSLRT